MIMKLYKYYLMMTSVLCLVASCDEKGTEGISRVTYYVDLELNGATDLFWPIHTPFVDPGFTAISKGEDVSQAVTIVGNVNTEEAGYYPLRYMAYNEDGFPKEQARNVYVYDTADSPVASAIWYSTTGSYRDAGGTIIVYGGSYPIIVQQQEPGVFYISDFLGGYYQYRAGYGGDYAAKGYFRLLEDYTLEFISGDVAGWGDSVDDLVDAKYDPATNTLSWGAEYAGMTFYVTITK
jgi:hypothetical protein